MDNQITKLYIHDDGSIARIKYRAPGGARQVVFFSIWILLVELPQEHPLRPTAVPLLAEISCQGASFLSANVGKDLRM
jgi:hypothetical protein